MLAKVYNVHHNRRCCYFSSPKIIVPEGDGTAGNPFQITNLGNLLWVAETPEHWDKHYLQMNDIQAYNSRWYHGGLGFLPIGTDLLAFSGVYNGDDYEINNLFINRPNQDCVGLFGYTVGATIDNIVLPNCDILGRINVGSLIGFGDDSHVSFCHSLGKIRGSALVGGLIGHLVISTLHGSSANANVMGAETAGGLLSESEHNTISECYFVGIVEAAQVGGLLRYALDTGIDNCYARAELSGSAGGFVNVLAPTGVIEYSFSASVLPADEGGFVLLNGVPDPYGNVTQCVFDEEVAGTRETQGGYNRLTPDMKDIANYNALGWDMSDVWDIDVNTNDGYPYLRDNLPRE